MSNTTELRNEALNTLRNLLSEGAVVSTILRHTSRSGMYRRISPVIIYKGEIRDISHLVARVTSFKRSTRGEGLDVSGAGMDMGFHVVYTLAKAVFGDGYALRQEWV